MPILTTLIMQTKCCLNDIQIKARDDTIGEKEKRIYELKKKNQELEKFKFVLDYKIKELKRQIEPRETEISAMKDQIKVCHVVYQHFVVAL
jgi:peptidoglycan hydrolase CwlO-like protein